MAKKNNEDRPGWLDQMLDVLISASGVLAVALLLADNWIGLVCPAVMLGPKFGAC